MSTRSDRGFSFVELVVAMAIMLAVTSSMLAIVNSARGVFEIDLERADMQQRARVSIDALFRDLVMAGAGRQMPPIAPFRRGVINPDAPGSAFSDRISMLYVSSDTLPGEAVTMTYTRRVDGAGVSQLTRYDGIETELPMVDQVADLRFEYFDAAGQQIAMGRFTDGPWIPGSVAADPFDADLQAIRRVRAIVRVRPARTFVGVPLADLEVAIDVSPRNVNLQ
jgi:prepilin-type N-terminal cleavage/methylation domain-containing protein